MGTFPRSRAASANRPWAGACALLAPASFRSVRSSCARRMSWEIFRCDVNCAENPKACINHALYEAQTDAIVSGGYHAAGYNQVSIDDCWERRGPGGEAQHQMLVVFSVFAYCCTTCSACSSGWVCVSECCCFSRTSRQRDMADRSRFGACQRQPRAQLDTLSSRAQSPRRLHA